METRYFQIRKYGPVAQRLEQGTHNLVFRHRTQIATSHMRERLRTKTTASDSGNVNREPTGRVGRPLATFEVCNARVVPQR